MIDMNDQELKSFLEENKKLIYSGNAKTILKNVHKEAKEIDLKILYDFLGEILIEKPVLQERKKQSKFLKGYNDFISKSQIPPLQVLKMERYFLEKYCILESEEILCSFLGNVNYKKIYFDNRVFITNFRIIVLSNLFKPGEGATFFPGLLILNIINVVEARVVKALRSSMVKSVEGSVTIEKPFFGYQLPISQLTAITLPKWKRGKYKGSPKSVNFTSETETDSFDLTISVNERLNDEENILRTIAEILQNLQEHQIAEST